MQKLNLNNIPEAPENKDFWVVGTANREGSIDSNSYKKNLGIMATKDGSSSYYVDTYPENPKEGDIITFTDATPSKEYINGEWKDRSAEGGGLPEITLLQAPVASGNVTITDYLSTEDIATLDESGVAVAKCGASNYVVVCEYDLNMSQSSLVVNFAFYGPTGLKFIFKHSGSFTAPWTVEMVPAAESHVLELTNVPAASGAVTYAQLGAMGLTEENIRKICEGKITHILQYGVRTGTRCSGVFPFSEVIAYLDDNDNFLGADITLLVPGSLQDVSGMLNGLTYDATDEAECYVSVQYGDDQ